MRWPENCLTFGIKHLSSMTWSPVTSGVHPEFILGLTLFKNSVNELWKWWLFDFFLLLQRKNYHGSCFTSSCKSLHEVSLDQRLNWTYPTKSILQKLLHSRWKFSPQHWKVEGNSCIFINQRGLYVLQLFCSFLLLQKKRPLEKLKQNKCKENNSVKQHCEIFFLSV